MQILSLKWPGLKKILKFIEMEECRGDKKNGQIYIKKIDLIFQNHFHVWIDIFRQL